MNGSIIQLHQNPTSEENNIQPASSNSSFIEANTVETTLKDITQDHIIPVFIKDNEPLISHSEFIDRTIGIAHHVFEGENVNAPKIRVSHPVKGRIPEAKGKPASQLLDHEKTLYYQRMAFMIEVPSISQEINGDKLTLSLGGIKAYNLDNLNRRKGAPEHFKIFIGFANKVCTNLCIWTDGFSDVIQVDNPRDLEGKIYDLISSFSYCCKTNWLNRFADYELSEDQFTYLIGRSRLYQYLPKKLKKGIPELSLNDTQIASIAKEYYQDENFSRASDGSINLWDLYNLFTGANKSSYIDTFLDRSVNAYQFTTQLADVLEENLDSWFLY